MPNVDLPIMIVDDAKFSGAVIGRTLKNAGFKDIRTASSAPQGLAMLESRPVNVLIADWLMPEMDGLTAARQIRELPGEVGEIPIVALTANAMQSDRETCISAGMDDFLTKPFDPSDLTGLIDQWGHGRKDDQKTTTAEAG